MELSSRHEEEEDGDGDIPMPMMIHHHEPAASPHNNHHHHQIMNYNSNSNSNGNINPNSSLEDHENHQQVVPYKKVTIRYRECLKNHAAAMGGNATDGCGEFMPSGEEGSIEALTCSACNCHRNFHRKDVEGSTAAADQSSPPSCDCFHSPHPNRGQHRKLHLLSHPHHHNHNAILGPAPESLGYPTRPTPHHHQQMIMSYNMGFIPNSDQSDEQEEDIGGGGALVRPAHHQQLMKKRHRTKFSQEQKEKMLNFAEKVGWKFQKQEESLVQQFCQEIGVKRRVLKVWMHNNKHNLTKKNMMNNSSIPQPTNSLT